jgi:hypothetical protein
MAAAEISTDQPDPTTPDGRPLVADMDLTPEEQVIWDKIFDGFWGPCWGCTDQDCNQGLCRMH